MNFFFILIFLEFKFKRLRDVKKLMFLHAHLYNRFVYRKKNKTKIIIYYYYSNYQISFFYELILMLS